MAYDQELAERINRAIRDERDYVQKKMFGGIGYLLNGNMSVGIWKKSLIARIGLEAYEKALEEPHVQEFNITGRAMRGWVMVAPEGLSTERDLKKWIKRARTFVETLPAK